MQTKLKAKGLNALLSVGLAFAGLPGTPSACASWDGKVEEMACAWLGLAAQMV